jgi:hypothetical protein
MYIVAYFDERQILEQRVTQVREKNGWKLCLVLNGGIETCKALVNDILIFDMEIHY